MPFRIHNFSLRLTDQEIASYERLARDSGVSVSEWARGVLNKEAGRRDEQIRAYLRRESSRAAREYYDGVIRYLDEEESEK